jgi:hypothetical protein
MSSSLGAGRGWNSMLPSGCFAYTPSIPMSSRQAAAGTGDSLTGGSLAFAVDFMCGYGLRLSRGLLNGAAFVARDSAGCFL